MTPSKRDSPVNGHLKGTSSKRAAIQELFDEAMDLEDKSTGDQSISDDQYNHYVEQRTAFGAQARWEAAAEHYPGKELCSLTKKDWDSIQGTVNARFGDLLMLAFPDNHFELNSLYLLRKQPP